MELSQNKVENSEHVKFLKKVITHKMSGTLTVTLHNQEEISISFTQGGLVGRQQQLSEDLGKYLSMPVLELDWQEEACKVNYGWIAPRILLSSVIMSMAMDKASLERYFTMFSKISDVTFTLKSLHFDRYGDYVEYQNLYRLSTKTETFSLYDYFSAAESEIILEKRIRVMLLVYTLGLIKKGGSKEKTFKLASWLKLSRSMSKAVLIGI